MTSEHRLIFEPADIEVVEFVCRYCGASVSLKPSEGRHFAGDQCPNCHQFWYESGSLLEKASKNLFSAIRALTEMQSEAKLSVRLHLVNHESK